MCPSNYLENKIPLETYKKVWPVCIKAHTHTSLEQPLVYNQGQKPLINQGWLQPY